MSRIHVYLSLLNPIECRTMSTVHFLCTNKATTNFHKPLKQSYSLTFVFISVFLFLIPFIRSFVRPLVHLFILYIFKHICTNFYRYFEPICNSLFCFNMFFFSYSCLFLKISVVNIYILKSGYDLCCSTCTSKYRQIVKERSEILPVPYLDNV